MRGCRLSIICLGLIAFLIVATPEAVATIAPSK
jgi:hypothetical protein